MKEYIITSDQYIKLIFAAGNHDYNVMDDIAEELEKNELIRCCNCKHYCDGRCYIDRDLGKSVPAGWDEYCSYGEVENG